MNPDSSPGAEQRADGRLLQMRTAWAADHGLRAQESFTGTGDGVPSHGMQMPCVPCKETSEYGTPPSRKVDKASPIITSDGHRSEVPVQSFGTNAPPKIFSSTKIRFAKMPKPFSKENNGLVEDMDAETRDEACGDGKPTTAMSSRLPIPEKTTITPASSVDDGDGSRRSSTGSSYKNDRFVSLRSRICCDIPDETSREKLSPQGNDDDDNDDCPHSSDKRTRVSKYPDTLPCRVSLDKLPTLEGPLKIDSPSSVPAKRPRTAFGRPESVISAPRVSWASKTSEAPNTVGSYNNSHQARWGPSLHGKVPFEISAGSSVLTNPLAGSFSGVNVELNVPDPKDTPVGVHVRLGLKEGPPPSESQRSGVEKAGFPIGSIVAIARGPFAGQRGIVEAFHENKVMVVLPLDGHRIRRWIADQDLASARVEDVLQMLNDPAHLTAQPSESMLSGRSRQRGGSLEKNVDLAAEVHDPLPPEQFNFDDLVESVFGGNASTTNASGGERKASPTANTDQQSNWADSESSTLSSSSDDEGPVVLPSGPDFKGLHSQIPVDPGSIRSRGKPDVIHRHGSHRLRPVLSSPRVPTSLSVDSNRKNPRNYAFCVAWGDVGNLTVKELRARLCEMNLSSSGDKAKLLDRLTTALENRDLTADKTRKHPTGPNDSKKQDAPSSVVMESSREERYDTYFTAKGSLEYWTLKQLRAKLRDLGHCYTGDKAKLVSRLKAALENASGDEA